VFDWKDIANRLSSRGVQKKCPACGTGGFEIGTEPFALMPVGADGRPHLDDSGTAPLLMPFASARCGNCGYTALHSIDVLMN
jgi:hypothetical protein